jgi:hypothetical protein
MRYNVILSSIIPRYDTDATQSKIENVNLELRTLCEQNTNETIVDNDRNFKLADGSPNEAFFLNDKTHLTYKGSERLIKNLSLDAHMKRRNRQYRHNLSYKYRNNDQQYHTYDRTYNYQQSFPDTLHDQHRQSCENCGLSDHHVYECPRLPGKNRPYKTFLSLLIYRVAGVLAMIEMTFPM